MQIVQELLDALGDAGSMAWQIGWSLVLGFTISAVVRVSVRRQTVVDLLGDSRPVTLARATGLGAASSSCSYAAVALSRSLFRKGASFTAAIVFEIASTNLVIELGIVIALILGWQLTLAEFLGGALMIVLVAAAFRAVLRPAWVEEARHQAEEGLQGSMEGHAAMDMSLDGEKPWWRRVTSHDGQDAVAHVFLMEWAAVLRDIVGGLLLAGAVSAWVPDSWWQRLFTGGSGGGVLDVVIAPAVAIVTFVCSVGNVPLAAVLYSGGLSVGGVVAFLFADLIILPILVIYRKYYGTRMMLLLLAVLYTTAAASGFLVGHALELVGLVPEAGSTGYLDHGVTWNYTTVLNFLAIGLASVLVVRSLRNGGWQMLRSMDDADQGPGSEQRDRSA